MDERERILQVHSLRFILIHSSQNDILLSPLLPTCRRPQADSRYQTLPEKSLYNIVGAMEQVFAERSNSSPVCPFFTLSDSSISGLAFVHFSLVLPGHI